MNPTDFDKAFASIDENLFAASKYPKGDNEYPNIVDMYAKAYLLENKTISTYDDIFSLKNELVPTYDYIDLKKEPILFPDIDEVSFERFMNDKADIEQEMVGAGSCQLSQ